MERGVVVRKVMVDLMDLLGVRMLPEGPNDEPHSHHGGANQSLPPLAQRGDLDGRRNNRQDRDEHPAL